MLRRSLLALPLLGLPAALRAADRLEAFGRRWQVPLDADWQVVREDGEEVLRLLIPRVLQANPRRPYQYALLEGPPLQRFRLSCEVRRDGDAKSRSLILVYAWRDPAHFNYAHLSGDSATEQPVHNGMFHVYGGDRVRISSDKGPGALPDGGWRRVQLAWDSATGLAETLVDGKPNPSLRAADLSLGPGRIGLGSFFNTAAFRRFELTAEPA
jgi:hypothetical protein